jgi:hypothetical protein
LGLSIEAVLKSKHQSTSALSVIVKKTSGKPLGTAGRGEKR